MTIPHGLIRERLENWRTDRDAVRALLQRSPGRVHFVGIGGIGMAGLAHLLHGRGFQVSGSDEVEGRTVGWLRAQGIPVYGGHNADSVPSAVDWVVKTPAVRETNCEVQRARTLGVPVYTRGVVLPALLDGRRSIAVSGTHGKTTTSAMIAAILDAAGRSPSYCIGGELEALGGVARQGEGDDLVVEADESDGTIRCYEPDIAVVTNVEYDHMEHFSNEDDFFDCFRVFAANARDRVAVCGDDERGLQIVRSTGAALVVYGRGAEAAVRAESIRLFPYRSVFQLRAEGMSPIDVELPAPGVHNAVNAAGAAAAARAAGVSWEAIVDGLRGFRPARRRFDVVCPGPPVTVISDYAHHPTEIRSVAEAAGVLPGARRIALYQPHRYTRTFALRDAFPPAFRGFDELVLFPVYAASEDPIPGGTSEDLLAAIQRQGSPPVRLADSLADGWAMARALTRPGDILLILGAGDIEQLVPLARREYGERED